MERYRLEPVHAFTVLQRYSQDRSQRLHDVARHVIDTEHLLG